MSPQPPPPGAGAIFPALDALLAAELDAKGFRSSINSLNRRFDIYASTCPKPLIAPGLIVTTELRIQSELYLPIADITAAFYRLYAAALTYPPIFSSTPFHNSLSWADTFVELPPSLQFSANPALLLAKLLTEREMLREFLFWSFLPRRFYGPLRRYPGQLNFIGEWLKTVGKRHLHCLDAACGTGEETYALALLLSEQGFAPEEICIKGWTLEPLEVWVAAHRRFPHDMRRETMLRDAASVLFQRGYGRSISFCCRDILTIPSAAEFSPEKCCSADFDKGCFDLILCNGLLGGPIIHDKNAVDRAIGNLARLLAPGGILLAADHFHGGWKQKCPQGELRAFLENNGLIYVATGEGVGGLKPD